MTVEILNPDSAVLGQLEGYWQRIATLIIWKAAKKRRVTLSAADMEQFQREFEAGGAVLLTHGHTDSIDFKIVTKAEADRIIAHDRTQRGNA